ncbi:MAG: phage baseplate protein [Crocinitomicaceae bacterium]|nr:phage baseplate protein [Crocinitomicaceae bacterium]|tara:strand:+ start:413 stop:802 length:390 start_codon:yes stop_codon:yes gene_type:complete
MKGIDYFFGVSYLYPREFNEDGSIALAGGLESVNQSIYSRLITPKGSRFMSREYGSYLHLLAFEPNDAVLHGLLKYFIPEALSGEKRIRFRSVDIVNSSENQVDCYVNYTLRSTQEQGTLIYPFYKGDQ